MMTLKQRLSTGPEFVFEVKSVNFIPGPTGGRRQPVLRQLIAHTPSESHIFMSGEYFLMNEAGKTVAKYDLGDEPS